MKKFLSKIITVFITSFLISVTTFANPINEIVNIQLISYDCSVENLKKEKKIVQEITTKLQKEKLGYKIAEKAHEYIGVLPYIWGAADLNYGCDCCGFTMCLYELYGVNIGRTVEEQAVNGYSVSLAEAEPGDVIIYAGHVALYIGNNKVIHCPQSGEYVKIAEVDMQPIWDIRRFE